VARNKINLGFVVTLAGPGLPGAEVLKTQIQALSSNTQELKFMEQWFGLLRSFNTTDGLIEAYTNLYRRFFSPLQIFKRLTAKNLGVMICSKWYHFFFKNDPASYWNQVQCPVLALFGEKDVQVESISNSHGMEKMLRQSGNQDYTIFTVPGANHLFQKSTRNKPNSKVKLFKEYSSTTETINPEVLEMITTWILMRWPKKENFHE
jgi:pimeloyl-ACP methyl ester carboxylesterase